VVVYLLLYIEQYLWVWDDDDDDVLNLFTVYVPDRTRAVEKLMLFDVLPIVLRVFLSFFSFL